MAGEIDLEGVLVMHNCYMCLRAKVVVMGPSFRHHWHLSLADSILLITYFQLFLWTQFLGGLAKDLSSILV